MVESVLARRNALSLSIPSPERLVLQRAAVGEAERPGLRHDELVDGAEVLRGQNGILSSRQEDDAGNDRRHVPLDRPKGASGHSSNRCLPGPVGPTTAQ